MENLRVDLRNMEGTARKTVHVVAVPYPAQGHIVPLMQLCRKLASEEGVMVTFVNTMHNHARMLQAELAAAEAISRETHYEKNSNHENLIHANCTSNLNINNYTCINSFDVNNNIGITQTKYCKSLTRNNTVCVNKKSINNSSGISNSYISTGHHLDETNFKVNNNIRLVGILGGLPPELHSDPEHIIATFQASEALREPLEKLLEKLNQEGPTVSCIISDVLMSWTQECADKISVPRYAFWTSSAAVYHVVWHMYGLISQGIPTFKGANTEIVSNIPGLPPMDLNDLPIIVRCDPADFIYQFLTRQLKPMKRAAAVLLNTFHELEADCLEALPATSGVPIYSIGPLLCPPVAPQPNVDGLIDGTADGVLHAATCKSLVSTEAIKSDAELTQRYKHAADREDRKGNGKVDGDGWDKGLSPCGESDGAGIKAGQVPEKAALPAEKAVLTGKKAVDGNQKAATTYRRGGAGIFSEDVSCIAWLDKRKPGSVLYISFGSIFAMSPDQFAELAAGLQASKQAFLWSIRPAFVQGTASYTHALPPSFLQDTHDRGMLISWVPQLSVLAHPAVAGFLTHCGWNSTLESVALGVPMLCWPDVGERRTNGRLAVSVWKAGLEFSYSLHKNGLLISREEVKRVILLLMNPYSAMASHLRAKAASLQRSAQLALSKSGSSSHDWNLFLQHIQLPNCQN